MSAQYGPTGRARLVYSLAGEAGTRTPPIDRGSTNLEIKWIELCREEHREQEHDSDVVRKVGRALPTEGCPVCGRELREDAPCLAPQAPRLAKPAPGVFLRQQDGGRRVGHTLSVTRFAGPHLDFEVLACLHAWRACARNTRDVRSWQPLSGVMEAHLDTSQASCRQVRRAATGIRHVRLSHE